MENGQMSVPINFKYEKESKMVQVWVSPFAMVRIPFEVFRNAYYEMDKAQKSQRVLVPDNNIIPFNAGG